MVVPGNSYTLIDTRSIGIGHIRIIGNARTIIEHQQHMLLRNSRGSKKTRCGWIANYLAPDCNPRCVLVVANSARWRLGGDQDKVKIRSRVCTLCKGCCSRDGNENIEEQNDTSYLHVSPQLDNRDSHIKRAHA